jgi:hypothetical protein
MSWIIRKPIWGSLEDPVLDPLEIDLGLGFHNGRPILTTGKDSDSIDHLVEIRRSIREYEQSN